MKLKAATMEELETAMGLIEEARAHLKEQGIDQWQNGRPNRDTVAEDIAKGNGYLMMAEGLAIGYFCLLPEGDAVYDASSLSWKAGSNYMAIHRVAMGDRHRGKGYAVKAFSEAEAQARAAGKEALRIDTHADNKKMQGLLTKLGFTCCGSLYIPDTGMRLAFEKRIIP